MTEGLRKGFTLIHSTLSSYAPTLQVPTTSIISQQLTDSLTVLQSIPSNILYSQTDMLFTRTQFILNSMTTSLSAVPLNNLRNGLLYIIDNVTIALSAFETIQTYIDGYPERPRYTTDNIEVHITIYLYIPSVIVN